MDEGDKAAQPVQPDVEELPDETGIPDAEAAENPVVADLEHRLAEQETRIAALNDSLKKAVSCYRTQILESNPEVLADLVQGDTIEALDTSLGAAKELIRRVRSGIESEIQHTRVPAGSSGRTATGFSVLSSREKIQFGLGGSA